jgi:predicted porin
LKKILFAFIVIMMNSSTLMASPLMDYSAGATSLDIMLRPSTEFTSEISNVSKIFDGDINVYDITFTKSIGHKLALQYSSYNPQTTIERSFISSYSNQFTLQNKEFNLLYKVNNNIALFTGLSNNKLKFDGDQGPGITHYAAETKKIWQYGLSGKQKLGGKVSLYEVGALGKNLTAWKVGLGYKLTKDVEFNVDYRYLQVNELTIPAFTAYKIDTTVKGAGAGLTVKF